jgi:hypothetical protein
MTKQPKRPPRLPVHVSSEEVEQATLDMLVERFGNRTLEIGVVQHGLTLALATLRHLALKEVAKKTMKGVK